MDRAMLINYQLDDEQNRVEFSLVHSQFSKIISQSEFEDLRLLPGKVRPPEMSVGCGLLEDRVLETEVLEIK